MANEDRLSQLPDQLLRHILHLAPCREAESTDVLSRRWRGLWPPPAGAVKIHIPSGDNGRQGRRGAEEALAGAHGPVQRLTVHVGGESSRELDAIVGDVLSHPACRGVQDVRIGPGAPRRSLPAAAGSDDSTPDSALEEVFLFDIWAVVPGTALRVLHMTNCCSLKPLPPESSFPCLEALRLRNGSVSLESLQDMVVASPRLTTLQLEKVDISPRPTQEFNNRGYLSRFPQSLCCPGVTTLVLVNCSGYSQLVAIELDVPRVQHFKYRGQISEFTLRSPLPDVRRANLHFLFCHTCEAEKCARFWNFLENFSHATVLKLKLEWPIDYVAAVESEEIGELLVENQSAQPIMFCVEHLEIDAPHNPGGNGVGLAMGNLLQCCPALHDLRLKLNTADQRSSEWDWDYWSASLEFQRSVDHFRRRRYGPLVPLCVEDAKFEVSDIPGLSDRWHHFDCLLFHLKRMSLQFDIDKANPSNCVGVRLMKFFIERAMALEEMYIDDGNMKLWEHINCKISRYEGNNPQPFPEYHVLARMSQAISGMNQFSSSKISGWFHQHKLKVRRNNPWNTSRHFTILPLERYTNEKF